MPCAIDVLKPPEMRMVQSNAGTEAGAELYDKEDGAEADPEHRGSDFYWPPPRKQLHCTTIQILDLHCLPKRGEQRPSHQGSRGLSHNYVPDFSGSSVPPTNSDISSPALHLALHPIGGFCAVSGTLPLKHIIDTEFVAKAVGRGGGLRASFDVSAHCVAAEPHSTFVRISVTDRRQEVAFASAVLGRLRCGFR
eukprot:839858-Prymnesium_polylepis.3